MVDLSVIVVPDYNIILSVSVKNQQYLMKVNTSTRENAKFWTLLAIFYYFVLNLRTFCILFTGLNNGGVAYIPKLTSIRYAINVKLILSSISSLHCIACGWPTSVNPYKCGQELQWRGEAGWRSARCRPSSRTMSSAGYSRRRWTSLWARALLRKTGRLSYSYVLSGNNTMLVLFLFVFV